MTISLARAENADAASDDELMVAYVRGEVAAFEKLYGRYEQAVYSFCLRLLGDYDTAADAFQETFVRIVDNSASYVPNDRFTGWLFTIARRVCVDELRRRDREKRSPLNDERADDDGDQADVLVEQRDEIARLMSVLPSEQREVLLLHRYFGFSYAEIANMTESTEAAVKQKAYRALRAIRESRL